MQMDAIGVEIHCASCVENAFEACKLHLCTDLLIIYVIIIYILYMYT